MKTDRFKHAYTSETEYDVIEVFTNGKERKVDPDYELYLDWIADENEPEIVSGSEFITIVDGSPVEDADKDLIIIDRKWDLVRAIRQPILDDTDKYLLSDYPIDPDDLNAIITYRQALRDITTQIDPYNIVWPTKPEI